jgi:hypothetical protein
MENSAEYFEANDEPERQRVSPISDVVSLETLVSVLIQKGVCTEEELFELERHRREYGQTFKQIKIVQTEVSDPLHLQREELRKKQNWVKRKMSRHRWSRYLGTKLFGWHWKKIRIEPHVDKVNHT